EYERDSNFHSRALIHFHFPFVQPLAFRSMSRFPNRSILDSARNDKNHSLDSGTAFSAALKPTFECVPSQNGFSVDAPHRQSAIRFSTGNLFPSASINSTSPVTT